MKRKIIKIDEEKCTGCGVCIPSCPEGALQIIDNKARLVSDLFCDGLGACIKDCPIGAMKIEEREAEEYSEEKVMQNIVKQGKNTIIAHLNHLKDHGEVIFLKEAVEFLKKVKYDLDLSFLDETKEEPFCCPGNKARNLKEDRIDEDNNNNNHVVIKQKSRLNQWPVQLKLLSPYANYFKNADLLIAADCVPFAYANFHERFLKDKIAIMFCPKLDSDIENYIEKLALIFEKQDIKSITILHMEVPCCSGTNYIVEKALEKSKKNILVKDYTISINGEII